MAYIFSSGPAVLRRTFVMMDFESKHTPPTQAAPIGGPPGPPKKTAGGLEDAQPEPRALPAKRAVLLILSTAQRDRATEVTMSPAANGGTAVQYRIDGTWHDWSTAGVPWSLTLPELEGLAGIRDAPYPKGGIICVGYSGVWLRWKINVTSKDSGSFLSDLKDEIV